MLFNSLEFIYLFLPITLAVFAALSRIRARNAAILWLVAASLFFYGWWDPRFIPLLVGSVVFNFLIANQLLGRTGDHRLRQALLVIGIAGNLGLLGWFKYAGFFAANLNNIAGAGLSVPAIILPLGISFFTFQQIAFLVDAHRGDVGNLSFSRYSLFVVFFPQLIAGPIVHHKEVLGQYAAPAFGRVTRDNLGVGVTIFSIGLFKKMVLADWTAEYANPVFGAAADGTIVTILEAWIGALAYSLQLYFDFSGYSDMAVGLAWMFGIRLPFNFHSPYKARNIIDFWRRWHITLSRFLRDYLYIPLGGNRRGSIRRYVNLAVVMLLGGLWHGANWTFVIWGGMHGIFLVINHGWHVVLRRIGRDPDQATRSGAAAARTLTIAAVVFSWVIFRADDMETAVSIWKSMLGLQGLVLPQNMIEVFGIPADAWLSTGRMAGHEFVNELFFYQDPLGPWLFFVLGLALFAPNTQEIVHRFGPSLDPWLRVPAAGIHQAPRIRWSPHLGWGIAIGLMFGIANLGMSRVQEFLYFQF